MNIYIAICQGEIHFDCISIILPSTILVVLPAVGAARRWSRLVLCYS